LTEERYQKAGLKGKRCDVLSVAHQVSVRTKSLGGIDEIVKGIALPERKHVKEGL
jgi:hypothetical protein